jgi:hypothetical protein
VRKLAARKGRDVPVGDAFGAGQAHVERPLPLLAPGRGRQLAFGLERFPALRRHPVEIGVMAVRELRGRAKPGMTRPSRARG